MDLEGNLSLGADDLTFFVAVHFLSHVTDDGESFYQTEYSGPFDFDSAQAFCVNIVGVNDKVRSTDILSTTQLKERLES